MRVHHQFLQVNYKSLFFLNNIVFDVILISYKKLKTHKRWPLVLKLAFAIIKCITQKNIMLTIIRRTKYKFKITHLYNIITLWVNTVMANRLHGFDTRTLDPDPASLYLNLYINIKYLKWSADYILTISNGNNARFTKRSDDKICKMRLSLAVLWLGLVGYAFGKFKRYKYYIFW